MSFEEFSALLDEQVKTEVEDDAQKTPGRLSSSLCLLHQLHLVGTFDALYGAPFGALYDALYGARLFI